MGIWTLSTFAVALDNLGISSTEVEVSLPFDAWQMLVRRLGEEQHEDPDADITKVTVAGIRYVVRRRS